MATKDEHRLYQKRVKDLTLAAGAGDLAAARTLLRADPTLVTRSDTAMLEACKMGQAAVVRFFLDAGAPVEAHAYPEGPCDRRPLTSVLGRNKNNPDWGGEHRATLDLLLERGADLGYQPGWAAHSALTAAAAGGNTAAIALLRPLRGEPLDLWESAALADRARVEALIAQDPAVATAPSPAGYTALHYAAHSALGVADPRVALDLAAIAEALMDAGCTIETQAEGCETYNPIRLAARIGNSAVMQVFARRSDETAQVFWCAAMQQDLAALDVLIATGRPVDLDAHGDVKRRNSVLAECLRYGQLQAADWLIAHGADPNFADTNGWTALHYAARRGVRPELIHALLTAGADPTAKTTDGERPADLARKPDIKTLLA